MKLIQHIRTKWKEIKIIDQYLIIIMIIMILYSASTVIFDVKASQNMTSIDIVIRTTIASIFGYFISSNFVKGEDTAIKIQAEPTSAKTINLSASPDVSTDAVGKIGFIKEEIETTDQNTLGQATTSSEGDPIIQPSNRLQIVIIGTLCIFTIMVLIGLRYFVVVTDDKVSTLSQFRDILCGSVGFLIGMPTEK